MSRIFPGTATNYLNIGVDPPHLDILGTALTIHAFVNSNSIAAQQFIFSKDGSSDRQYALTLETSKIRAVIGNGGGTTDLLFSNTTLMQDTLYALSMVKNGTGAGALKVYINGTEDNTISSSVVMGNSASPVAIGGRGNETLFFSGTIGPVAVWDFALSAGELTQLAQGVSPFLIQPDNLQGYWPLCGTGAPEPDWKNGNDASVRGSVTTGPRIYSDPCEGSSSPLTIAHLSGRGAV